MTSDRKYSLSEKWVMIAREAAETSEYFCLCAADNYYHPHLIWDAEAGIAEADWCLLTKGFFYDFHLDSVVYYDYNSLIGLCMAARTSFVRQFPLEVLPCGIDGWFSEQMKIVAHEKHDRMLHVLIFGNDHWKKMLCTNGLNNISIKRRDRLKDPKAPFYPSEVPLDAIVPFDIVKRLKDISQCLKSQ
jgi:hypothetical protein